MLKMKSLMKFVMLMAVLLISISASAASENVTMKEGETKTLYLPSSVTSKRLKSVNFYSNGISYVQVLSHTNYSVTVKAIKAFSSKIVVRCDYRYYITSGSYTYEASGYYDFNVTVESGKVGPTSIKFPSSVAAVEEGASRQLEVTVLPENAEYSLTWKIVDTSVATISQSGLLTGVREGATDLKVTADNGVYAMLRIVVSKSSAAPVVLCDDSIVEVYSMHGVLVYMGEESAMPCLPCGLYVKKSRGVVSKMFIGN